MVFFTEFFNVYMAQFMQQVDFFRRREIRRGVYDSKYPAYGLHMVIGCSQYKRNIRVQGIRPLFPETLDI